jgi:hypothetical protein
MRKTALLTLGAMLLAGSATAGEQDRKADDASAITQDTHSRRAYDQLNEPTQTAPLTPEEERNKEDFGFSGRSPSRPGGEDPNLNPPS